MATTSARSQIARALQLVQVLRARRFPSARELAETCEVSRRTIYRDIRLLLAAGVPVRYDPDRQGFGLVAEFRFADAPLDETEALPLMLLAQAGHGTSSHGMRDKALAATWKIVAVLPPGIRKKVQSLSDLTVLRGHPLSFVPDRCLVYEQVLDAVTHRVQIRIWYREDENTRANTTRVHPYALLIDGVTWYLIGRSTVHRAVKVFALPWIERIERTDDPAVIPPRFNLERFLGDAWCVEGGEHAEICLRFSPRVAQLVREIQWHHSQQTQTLDGGFIEMRLSLDGTREVLGWILSFGEDAEVVSPPALRSQLCQLCRRLGDRYRARPAAHTAEDCPLLNPPPGKVELCEAP